MICALIGVILILTRSRAGYLAGAIGLICVLFLHRKHVIATIFSVGVILMISWLLISSETTQTNVIVADLANTGTFDFRLKVWQVALQMLRDFPFTGIGMGTFNDVATRLYPFPMVPNPGAHNLFLQVGVDLGILGLIAYLSLIFLIFLLAWQAQRILGLLRDTWLWASMIGALSAMLALAIHGIVDITVWGTRVAFIPWSVMALIVVTYLYAYEQELLRAKPDNK